MDRSSRRSCYPWRRGHPRRPGRSGLSRVLLAGILAAAAATPAVATGHGEIRRSGLVPDAGAPTVLVVPGGLQGGAWGAMRDGIVAAAGDLGLDVEIPEVATTSPERTRDEQINLIESARDQEFGGALVIPADTAALRPYAEEAVAAGVPFILALHPLEGVGSAVVYDEEAAAAWLARTIIGDLGERLTVATIHDPDGDDATITAFREVMADIAPRARLAPAVEVPTVEAVELTVEELTFTYPELDVLVVAGGESLAAAVSRTRFIPELLVAGVGTGRTAIDLWESGAVDLLVVPDLWEIGYRALETLELLRRGEVVPSLVTVPGILLEQNSLLPPGTLESLQRVDR